LWVARGGSQSTIASTTVMSTTLETEIETENLVSDTLDTQQAEDLIFSDPSKVSKNESDGIL
jgi:regulatory protein YycH of two-component signal transduction system YycFG